MIRPPSIFAFFIVNFMQHDQNLTWKAVTLHKTKVYYSSFSIYMFGIHIKTIKVIYSFYFRYHLHLFINYTLCMHNWACQINSKKICYCFEMKIHHILINHCVLIIIFRAFTYHVSKVNKNQSWEDSCKRI